MSSVQGHSAPDETHTLSVVCIDQSLSLRTHPSILTGGLPWGVMGKGAGNDQGSKRGKKVFSNHRSLILVSRLLHRRA